MGKKLYVGNLSYDVDSSSLQELFSAHGAVQSAEVIADRETGRSKGFGFVEFESDDDNQKAVDQLNGKELDGRTISVNLARPREERPRREFNGNGGGNNRDGGSFRQRSW